MQVTAAGARAASAVSFCARWLARSSPRRAISMIASCEAESQETAWRPADDTWTSGRALRMNAAAIGERQVLPAQTNKTETRRGWLMGSSRCTAEEPDLSGCTSGHEVLGRLRP